MHSNAYNAMQTEMSKGTYTEVEAKTTLITTLRRERACGLTICRTSS